MHTASASISFRTHVAAFSERQLLRPAVENTLGLAETPSSMSSTTPLSPAAQSLASDAKGVAKQLLKEGGRGAVLLGAARLDLSLELLLKAVLRPNTGGDDNLFDNERPLGTYSAKISLAYRLGLIDKHVEHALQMIRKVRNDFAHSFEDTDLAESAHKNRLLKPYAEAKKGVVWQKLGPALAGDETKPQELRDFVCLVVTLTIMMGLTASKLATYNPGHQVKMVEASRPESKA
jgi:hypothetical protein